MRIEIGNNVLMVPASLFRQSSLYDSMMTMCLSSPQTQQSTQTKYNTMHMMTGVSQETSLDYVLYLLQKQNKSKSALIDNFNHCSLLDDEGYLLHCIQQLLTQHFDDYTSIVNSLNDNLQYEIYIHMPLIMIPKENM